MSESVALTTGQERAALWIEANASRRAVFVTDAYINSPVDYAGRLRITTCGRWAAPSREPACDDIQNAQRPRANSVVNRPSTRMEATASGVPKRDRARPPSIRKRGKTPRM
jgi:hypothetical protein